MKRTLQTFAFAGVLAAALAACSTDMANRSDDSSGASSAGASMSGGSATKDLNYDGLDNNNGLGEAGSTPTKASLSEAANPDGQ